MEIIPKAPEKVPISKRILQLLFFLILIFLFLLYFYLKETNKRLSQTKANIEKEIEKIDLKDLKEKEEKLIALNKQLSLVKEILSNHIFVSKIFPLFEKSLLKSARIESFSFSHPNKVEIEMRLKNLDDLGKQYFLFQKLEEIEDFEISNLGLKEDGGIGFKISLSVKPNYLK